MCLNQPRPALLPAPPSSLPPPTVLGGGGGPGRGEVGATRTGLFKPKFHSRPGQETENAISPILLSCSDNVPRVLQLLLWPLGTVGKPGGLEQGGGPTGTAAQGHAAAAPGGPEERQSACPASPVAGCVVAPLRVRGNLGGAACSVPDEGPGEGVALVPTPTLYPAPTPSHLVLTLTPELRSPFYR